MAVRRVTRVGPSRGITKKARCEVCNEVGTVFTVHPASGKKVCRKDAGKYWPEGFEEAPRVEETGTD